jgi:hypothetical protein
LLAKDPTQRWSITDLFNFCHQNIENNEGNTSDDRTVSTSSVTIGEGKEELSPDNQGSLITENTSPYIAVQNGFNNASDQSNEDNNNNNVRSNQGVSNPLVVANSCSTGECPTTDQFAQSLKEFQHNLLAKWDIYGDAIQIITKFADQIVYEELKNQSISSSTVNMENSIQHLFGAVSLYTYALTLLKDVLLLFDRPKEKDKALGVVIECSNNNLAHLHHFLDQMKYHLIQMFDSLLERLENSQQWIRMKQTSIPNHEKLIMCYPKAEYLMLQEALTLETEARIEEVFGTLER